MIKTKDFSSGLPMIGSMNLLYTKRLLLSRKEQDLPRKGGRYMFVGAYAIWPSCSFEQIMF